MKTGAGEDPFADETGDDRDEETGGRDEPERSGTGGPAGRERTERTGDRSGTGRDTGSAETGPTGDTGGQVQSTDLPFIARRNARGENIKAGRETRRLFELRPSVAEREEQFMAEVSRELGVDVSKTDAREAALAVVYERPELVAEKLEEWGINYFDR